LTDEEKSQGMLAVSPKSIYHLCDYLGVSELGTLALTEYQRQLTVSVIDTEVRSDLFMCHEAVRKMVMTVRSSRNADFWLNSWQWIRNNYKT
jgi:hypothetical protein